MSAKTYDLNAHAMSHMRRKSVNNLVNTSPRQMLMTGEVSSYDHTSAVTEAILTAPIDKTMRGTR